MDKELMFNFRLNEDDKEKLQELADFHKRPMGEYIRWTIQRDWLEMKRQAIYAIRSEQTVEK